MVDPVEVHRSRDALKHVEQFAFPALQPADRTRLAAFGYDEAFLPIEGAAHYVIRARPWR